MTQQLVVSVDASSERPDLMTVQDVFTHVLDLFQLVGESDLASSGEVVWRLVSVNMNSPLTVTAEAVPARPGIAIEHLAIRQKAAFASNYLELKTGHIPAAWSRSRDTVSRFLARNRNGIGRTTVDASVVPGDMPITLTKQDADLVVAAVAVNAPQMLRTKEQVGSIEGRLVLIDTHYGQPAIQIEERKTRQLVWCVVPEEFQHQISESASIEDVWRGSRVVVRGKLTYGSDGRISRVVASAISRIDPVDMADSAIADPQFTGGLPISEYLDRFRDGKLG